MGSVYIVHNSKLVRDRLVNMISELNKTVVGTPQECREISSKRESRLLSDRPAAHGWSAAVP